MRIRQSSSSPLLRSEILTKRLSQEPLRKIFSKIFPRTVGTAVCVSLVAVALTPPANAQRLRGIDAVRVAGGFTQPLYVSAPPGDTGRLFIVEQTGKITSSNSHREQ